MKKSEHTLEKIIYTATILFGENGYSATSIGDISKKAEISRGILYYYVKNKDELYLRCLDNCSHDLYNYLDEKYKKIDTLYDFVILREKFIKEYPQYSKILFYLMAEKPDNLSVRIKELKQPIFDLDRASCAKFLDDINLGEHITLDDALGFLWIIQQSIPSMLTHSSDKPISEQLSRIMNIYLNGLTQDL